MEQFFNFLAGIEFNIDLLIIVGAALGGILLVFGLKSAVATSNPAADRLAVSDHRRQARLDQGILKPVDRDPKGLMKSFVPTDEAHRTELRRKLQQAGQGGPDCVMRFMLKRVVFALLLPALFLGLVTASREVPGIVPDGLARWLGGLSNFGMFQWLTLLIAVGYFGPLRMLDSRVEARQQRIADGFPNALDLLQISVEAGLGFDSAMTRVGNELATVSPDIAFEFLSVQHEVHAGRSREAAMKDMADRIGLDFVHSFVNVVRQSMQLGTSMTDALNVYSEELRGYRETLAQEKANKLPVKMSAVLAALMLPALILLSVGPVVIRYANYFAAN
ncbi:type II secretion system F family protein [Aliiruegeria lutimaris]|uniref:Tight adherence protein C n=1 Tax=Aliiruegeria lutimaris TaxID=571298 RepID=A0A1G9JY19_9RHOB|nr:type II secretion system F family protein [Aliiruegeria lutimaris]SDL41783.1 tight adherence protein C [Aliiruegeria lutimaris]